jgi:phosphoribosyl 1,2-cyclic phosphate phosphodiesterase
MAHTSIEFLGTGTSQGVPVIACGCAVCTSTDPRDNRLRSSVIVRYNGATILIDAGPDLRQQMLRAKVTDVDAVLLTHEHMDHIAGIDELRSFNFHLQRPMDIYANVATNLAVRRMFHYAFATEHRYPGVPELVLHELGAGAVVVAGVPVQPLEVLHYRMPVLGFRIGNLAYITDAKTISPDVMEQIHGVDVLVLNALRKKTHISHLNMAEALEVVEKVNPRQAFFTHISHLLGTHAEVDGELPEGVALAYDGLAVEIS